MDEKKITEIEARMHGSSMSAFQLSGQAREDFDAVIAELREAKLKLLLVEEGLSAELGSVKEELADTAAQLVHASRRADAAVAEMSHGVTGLAATRKALQLCADERDLLQSQMQAVRDLTDRAHKYDFAHDFAQDVLGIIGKEED